MAIIDLTLRRREPPTRVGYVYEVWRDGEMMLASINPELAASRLLANQGVRGRVRFWRDGRPAHDSEMDIQRAAKFTVRENEQHGPRFVKFKPFVAPADIAVQLEAAA
jgi:hypothetical protein